MQGTAAKRDAERAKRALAAYVQARLKEESKTRGRIAQIAKVTGYTTAHLANAKNHGSIGEEFARAMAQFWGMDFEEMRKIAMAGAPPTPPPPAVRELVIELDPRYPNLSLAIAFCQHRVRPEAIERVKKVSHRSKEDLTPERWLKLIEAEDTRLEFMERDPASVEREQRLEAERSRELEDELAPPAARRGT